jgi:hypothetical protein
MTWMPGILGSPSWEMPRHESAVAVGPFLGCPGPSPNCLRVKKRDCGPKVRRPLSGDRHGQRFPAGRSSPAKVVVGSTSASHIAVMCGRGIQSSAPIRYAIVDGMNARDSRVHNYPPRWNGAPSQDLLVMSILRRASISWRSPATSTCIST